VIVEQVHHEPPQQSAVGRARLLIIGAVAVLAAGVGIVLGSALVGGGAAGLAPAAAYAPADAVMYAEARLDLPGSQRANLRGLLERFPAADADAILTDALAGTLDAALADTGAPFDYSTDVAPWFDGTLAMVLLDYPMNMDPTQMRLPSVVGLFGVRDAAAAVALADDLRSELEAEGSTFTSSEHDGVTIWTLEVDDASAFGMPMQGTGFAYAVTDDQLLLGNGADPVRAALEARGGSGLTDAGEIGGLLGALPTERSGTMVMNSQAMLAEMRAELDAVQPGLAEALGAYLDSVPPYSVASLAFGADAFLVDAVAARPTGPLQPQNADRTFAERLPAETLFYADGSGLGAALEQVIITGKSSAALMPDGDQALAELENVEAAIGADLEEFVSWIGDGGMAAGWDGEAPWFGVVLRATDVDAANQRLTQIGALAELAAGQGDGDVTVSTDTVDGVEVTTVAFGASGAPAMGEFSFAYALDGDTALIGTAGFVEAALTLDPASSLASSDRFGAAVDRFGGSDNAGVFYLDLSGLVNTVRAEMPPEATSGMDEVWPNLAPLDYLGGVTRVEGDRVVSRIALVLR
jgi:hypothetical protein